MKSLSMLAVLLPLALPPAAAVTATGDPSEFAPLGRMGGVSTIPTAISADGSTVVGWTGTDPSIQAFRWRRATGFIGLADLPGGEFHSVPSDVSADGATVVGTGSTEDGSRAFRWTPSNGMEQLSDMGKEASGVSADGSVIIGHTVDCLPFRWVAGELSLLPFWVSHTAKAVSANGSIVLMEWFWEVCTGDGYGECGGGLGCGNGGIKLWNVSGIVVDVYDASLIGNAISADGSTVIGNWNWLAATWTVGAGRTVLDTEIYGDAFACSGDGAVVVGGMILDPWSRQSVWKPFIWTLDGGLHPLQLELETVYGLDLTGWTIDWVTDISADGRTLVGTGTNPDGEYLGWIAHLGTPLADVGQFIDIGPGLGDGYHFVPRLSGHGSLSPGSSSGFTVSLWSPPTLTCGMLFVSLGQGAVPFKGGTFYPTPIVVGLPIATDVDGTLSLGGSIPRGTPPGTSFVLQAWVNNFTAPSLNAGSNGLKLVVP
jgi:uncharacterized membrane protein